MPSGPSKQELEMYWQNSRQYFDELANHYRQTDPDYYNKYILPFYNNPFAAASSGSGKNKTGNARLLTVAAMTLIIGIAGAVFLLIPATDPGNKKIERMEKVAPDTAESRNTENGNTESGSIKTDQDTIIHFKRGMDFFRQGKYLLAERYLRNVPESDKHYREARETLKIIYETDEYKNRNNRNIRKKPIERVR